MAAILRKKTDARKKKKTKEKNPYSERGLDKFSVLLAEIEAKREKIAAKFGVPLSTIKFSIRSRRKLVPIISSISKSQNRISVSDSGHGMDLTDKSSDSCTSRENLTAENGGSLGDVAASVPKAPTKGKVKPWVVEKLLPRLKVAMAASRKTLNTNEAGVSMDIWSTSDAQSSAVEYKANDPSSSKTETSRAFIEQTPASALTSSSSQIEAFYGCSPVRENEIQEEENDENLQQNKRSKTVKFATALSPNRILRDSKAPSSSYRNSCMLKVSYLGGSVQKTLAASSRNGANSQKNERETGPCIHVQALTGLTCIVVALSGLYINHLVAIVSIICWCYALPFLRKTIGDSSIHHHHQQQIIHNHGNLERRSQPISNHGSIESDTINEQVLVHSMPVIQGKLHVSDSNKMKSIDFNSKEYKKKVFMDGLLDRQQQLSL